MAITVNSVTSTNAMPSAPQRLTKLDIAMDNSYPTNGESVAASLPDGATVKWSETVPNYDGSALRWFRIEMVSGVARIKAYVSTGGAPGAEVANTTDLSGHTSVLIGCVHE